MLSKPELAGSKKLVTGVFMKPLTWGDNTLLCEFRLNKGAVIPAHQHPHEQTGYLVKGSVRFFGDEGEKVVTPGYSWCFKGGKIHGAEALVDSILIEVFSPIRQEYLPK